MFRADGRRPDGLTLVPWCRGRFLTWDFTCADRYIPSYSREAALPGPTIANKVEDRKCVAYADIGAEYVFQPIAVESLGGYGQSTAKFIKELGRRLRIQTLDDKAGSYLRQRLGVAVQLSNAACVLSKLLTEP